MTTYPQINAGTTPTVAILLAMLPLIADKGTDQPLSSSMTLQNDTALVVPVAANAKYKFELEILYKGFTTGSGDLKIGWAVPSGATIAGRFITVSNPLGVAIGYFTQSGTLFSASNGTGNPLACTLAGTLTTLATPGSLQLTWAQNTSSATATTVMAGSSLTAWRRA